MSCDFNEESHHFQAPNTPFLFKYSEDQNISDSGAFPYDFGKISFELHVPLSYSSESAVLKIAKDGFSDLEFKFSPLLSKESALIFSLDIDTRSLVGESKSGLFFYEINLNCKNDILYSHTDDNLTVSFGKSPGNRFVLTIFNERLCVPESFAGSSVYHIFVDRFYKGDIPLCSPSSVFPDDEYSISHPPAFINQDWYSGTPQFSEYPGAPLCNNMFFGGTLFGVADKLEYIASLGINMIYLSPIFKAYSNHKYDTGDYTVTDAMFGGNEALTALIKKASSMKIGIILDGVFNHTGDDSLYFNKYGTYNSIGASQSHNSPFRSWYSFHDNGSYESWWGISILPRLNHSTEACRKYFTGENGIAAKYLDQGIYGWRLDVADELSDEFLDEFHDTVKSKGGIIIGEVWENAAEKIAYGKRRHYFTNGQLDSVMNYPFRSAVISFAKDGNAEELGEVLVKIWATYPREVCHALLNIVGSHDTERILTRLGSDLCGKISNAEAAKSKLSPEAREHAIRLLILTSAIQYTVYGVPSLYYGDEIGMEGYGDPFCRYPYPWGREDTSLLDHYRQLGYIRKSESALSRGDFKLIYCKNSVIIYDRISKSAYSENQKSQPSHLRIIANASSSPFTVEVPHSLDLLNGETINGALSISPYSVKIIKIN